MKRKRYHVWHQRVAEGKGQLLERNGRESELRVTVRIWKWRREGKGWKEGKWWTPTGVHASRRLSVGVSWAPMVFPYTPRLSTITSYLSVIVVILLLCCITCSHVLWSLCAVPKKGFITFGSARCSSLKPNTITKALSNPDGPDFLLNCWEASYLLTHQGSGLGSITYFCSFLIYLSHHSTLLSRSASCITFHATIMCHPLSTSQLESANYRHWKCDLFVFFLHFPCCVVSPFPIIAIPSHLLLLIFSVLFSPHFSWWFHFIVFFLYLQPLLWDHFPTFLLLSSSSSSHHFPPRTLFSPSNICPSSSFS